MIPENRLLAALREILGDAPAEAVMGRLIDRWPAGARVHVPPAAGVVTAQARRARDERIHRQRRQGLAISTLAARHGLTRRQVYRILSRQIPPDPAKSRPSVSQH